MGWVSRDGLLPKKCIEVSFPQIFDKTTPTDMHVHGNEL